MIAKGVAPYHPITLFMTSTMENLLNPLSRVTCVIHRDTCTEPSIKQGLSTSAKNKINNENFITFYI